MFGADSNVPSSRRKARRGAPRSIHRMASKPPLPERASAMFMVVLLRTHGSVSSSLGQGLHPTHDSGCIAAPGVLQAGHARASPQFVAQHRVFLESPNAV